MVPANVVAPFSRPPSFVVLMMAVTVAIIAALALLPGKGRAGIGTVITGVRSA